MFTKAVLFIKCFGQILPFVKCFIACQWALSSVQSIFHLANYISYLNIFKTIVTIVTSLTSSKVIISGSLGYKSCLLLFLLF